MFLIGYFGRERSINTKHINKNISHHLKADCLLDPAYQQNMFLG